MAETAVGDSPKDLKWYRLYNHRLKQHAVVEAPSAQEACESQGWMIGDCWVRELDSDPRLYLPGKMGIRRTQFNGFKD